MSLMASQITSLTIVYSTSYSGVDQRKHQSSASLAFVRGIHRGPVNSPHKWPVTRKMFPFDDVIMVIGYFQTQISRLRDFAKSQDKTPYQIFITGGCSQQGFLGKENRSAKANLVASRFCKILRKSLILYSNSKLMDAPSAIKLLEIYNRELLEISTNVPMIRQLARAEYIKNYFPFLSKLFCK